MSELIINALLNKMKVKTDDGPLNVSDLFGIDITKLEQHVLKYYNLYKKVETTPPCFKKVKITQDEQNYKLLEEIYNLRQSYEEERENQIRTSKDNNEAIQKLLEIREGKKFEQYEKMSPEELDVVISTLKSSK